MPLCFFVLLENKIRSAVIQTFVNVEVDFLAIIYFYFMHEEDHSCRTLIFH